MFYDYEYLLLVQIPDAIIQLLFAVEILIKFGDFSHTKIAE